MNTPLSQWEITEHFKHVMFLNIIVTKTKSSTRRPLTVSAIPEHVQIYHFLSKIHWFLSKLYRKLSKFKWHFWEFWQFIPPQNSISGLWEWMCKNFFIIFIISWVILKKLYFFSKFGQEYVRIPPAPYLGCANLDRNLDNLDKFSNRLKWMTVFIHSCCKNDIIICIQPSTWCNTWM